MTHKLQRQPLHYHLIQDQAVQIKLQMSERLQLVAQNQVQLLNTVQMAQQVGQQRRLL